MEHFGPSFMRPRWVDRSRLPERNPLHERALTKEELRVGMSIERYHKKERTKSGSIIGSPIWNEKFRDWMLPVMTTDYSGKTVHAKWAIADLGIEPYYDTDGLARWHDANYTLAVEV